VLLSHTTKYHITKNTFILGVGVGFQLGLGLLVSLCCFLPAQELSQDLNGAGSLGFSAQINPFLLVFLCLAKGSAASGQTLTGSRAGRCHKPVFLGDSRVPCLTFRKGNCFVCKGPGRRRVQGSVHTFLICHWWKWGL
jgi:hypothetical protein